MKGSMITVHMIIKNEEQWVWYALQSVMEIASKIIIYDTGSTDKTIPIIAEIASNKIDISEKGRINASIMTQLRNEQLEQTKTDWFMLLDGDEVWPKVATYEVQEELKNSINIHAFVSKARVPIGDLFHYQPEIAGKYSLLGRVGHYNIRLYRKLPGYYWEGIYPNEAYVDKNGIPIQQKTPQLKLLRHHYWHLTHLPRSSVDTHSKRKYEIGKNFKLKLPEVFFADRPTFVPSPWVKYSTREKVWAYLITPILKIKRKVRNIKRSIQ